MGFDAAAEVVGGSFFAEQAASEAAVGLEAFGGIGASAAELSAASASAIATVGGTAAAGLDVLGTLKTAATILSPVASLLQAASGVKTAGRVGQISGAPRVLPPITMPIANAPDTQQAIRNSQIAQQRRRGRASTILTQPEDDRLG